MVGLLGGLVGGWVGLGWAGSATQSTASFFQVRLSSLGDPARLPTEATLELTQRPVRLCSTDVLSTTAFIKEDCRAPRFFTSIHPGCSALVHVVTVACSELLGQWWVTQSVQAAIHNALQLEQPEPWFP